jgi:hypothetical protein
LQGEKSIKAAGAGVKTARAAGRSDRFSPAPWFFMDFRFNIVPYCRLSLHLDPGVLNDAIKEKVDR